MAISKSQMCIANAAENVVLDEIYEVLKGIAMSFDVIEDASPLDYLFGLVKRDRTTALIRNRPSVVHGLMDFLDE